MQKIYDIAVIGSGPAGSFFCKYINSSYSVIVLDKKSDSKNSYNKPCGGLLSPDSQKILKKHNLQIPQEIIVKPQLNKVKVLSLDTKITQNYRRDYINIDRSLFDLWLKKIIPSNIVKITGRCISLKKYKDFFEIIYTNDSVINKFYARKIVGADGANSLVRKTFFYNKHIRSYIAIQQWFDTNTPNIYSCIFDPETSPSCSWSLIKDKSLIFGGAFKYKNCKLQFEKQKKKLTSFGYDFSNPIKTEACLVLCPKHVSDIIYGCDNIYLIGEAAAMISPSSFEGISYALNSGYLLATACNTNKNILQDYKKKCKFLRRKIFIRICKRPFMYNPLIRNIVLKSKFQSEKK